MLALVGIRDIARPSRTLPNPVSRGDGDHIYVPVSLSYNHLTSNSHRLSTLDSCIDTWKPATTGEPLMRSHAAKSTSTHDQVFGACFHWRHRNFASNVVTSPNKIARPNRKRMEFHAEGLDTGPPQVRRRVPGKELSEMSVDELFDTSRIKQLSTRTKRKR